jgi:hypothetical protein
VDNSLLTTYLARLHAGGVIPLEEPAKVADGLVRDGILTFFQAEQLLQGQWRRFSIGKYKVLERIGAGRTAGIYLCEHGSTHRRVAVKVLPTALADDPAAVERFYREARALAALNHPNIVRAYDIDQIDKLYFLVMEYVDGPSLQYITEKRGPMAVKRLRETQRSSAFLFGSGTTCLQGTPCATISPSNSSDEVPRYSSTGPPTTAGNRLSTCGTFCCRVDLDWQGPTRQYPSSNVARSASL